MNWCKLMDGTSKQASNYLIKIAVMVIKSKVPELKRQCPIGPIIIDKFNITLDSKVIAMFPNGIYRIIFLWKHKNGEVMLNISFLIETL